MAEFPALPIFTDAYLADTRHLTTEEHGAYLLLLLCAWRTRGCSLKDDDRQLARIAGVGPARWRKLKPVLIDFFTVEQGFWRQKKLTYVYETVSSKVARNRASGARGGRATAAKKMAVKSIGNSIDTLDPKPVFSPGWPLTSTPMAAVCPADNTVLTELKADTMAPSSLALPAIPEANASALNEANTPAPCVATKTKTKNHSQSRGRPLLEAPQIENSGSLHWVEPVAAAAGLDAQTMDGAVYDGWCAAGADLHGDILPTVRRLASREMARTGKVPKVLAYYQQAILEARDHRLKAVYNGQAHAADRPAAPKPVRFNKDNFAHWQMFLGDPANRFKGDYLSQNWHIPSGHPQFLPTQLGPDPRQSKTSAVPAEIQEIYGPAWGWRI